MRLFIVFILALLFSLPVMAQVNYPIPQDSTSEWRIWTSQWDPLSSYVFSADSRVFVSGDTVINGHVYSRLLCSGLYTFEYQGQSNSVPFENEFYAFIRTDTARTYVFMDGQDYLLYDFSLQPGDTLPETMINWNTVVISSIDSVLVADKYLKRFNIYDSVNGDLMSHWYIEGIGHEFGLIEPMYMMLDNGNWFECYAENGAPVFPEGSTCDLAVGMTEKVEPGEMINLWPNPSEGKFTLAFNSRLDQVIQFQLSGSSGNALIHDTWHVTKGMNERLFDFSKVSNGIYFIIMQNENILVQKMIIIIH